jgi:hypothetical protein
MALIGQLRGLEGGSPSGEVYGGAVAIVWRGRKDVASSSNYLCRWGAVSVRAPHNGCLSTVRSIGERQMER